MTPEEKKQKAIDILRRRYDEQRQQVADIEPRLTDYFVDLCTHSSVVHDDPEDRHNLYEILDAIKFLRLLRTYEFNHKKVAQVIRLREGQWQQSPDGRWHHLGGGLRQPGTQGAEVFRWQPFQIFVLASVFGFQAWIDTQLYEGDRELRDTERLE